MMHLLVDLGNTRLKWALRGPDGTPAAGSAGYEGDSLPRLDALWGALLPERVIVASVAGSARTAALGGWVRARWGREMEGVQAEREAFGVRNDYFEPSRLGADRWAALVGARGLVPGPACVVDCGTALTIDALSGEGVFLGGVILPGIASARRCLQQRTQGVVGTEGDPSSCLGRSTADGVAAGTAFGLAGAIERVVAEHRRVLGSDVQILLTGGEMETIMPRLREPVRPVPDLVLIGLERIAGLQP